MVGVRSADNSVRYVTPTYTVVLSYAGWTDVNYVPNNVRNPVPTLKIAAPLGLDTCPSPYLLANIAHSDAATKVRPPPSQSVIVRNHQTGGD